MPYNEMDVKKLDVFFKAQENKLPVEVRLGPGVVVTNLPLFIGTQFTTLKAANGKPSGQIAFDRLNALYLILSGAAKT